VNKYGSWRSEVPQAGWDIGMDESKAAKLGFLVLMWIGIFWAGSAWLVLWVIRSSGYTSFDVAWWKLCLTSIVLTIVRAMDKRALR
jgi:hypothetical protein